MLVMAYFGSHYSLNAYKGGILVSLVIVVANIVLTMLITMAMTAFLKRCIFRKVDTGIRERGGKGMAPFSDQLCDGI